MPDERFAHGCDSRADRVADIEVSCFCEARDLLSQWRGYGPYRGFAIGFSKRALAEIDSIERAPVLLDDSGGDRTAGPRLLKRMVGVPGEPIPVKLS